MKPSGTYVWRRLSSKYQAAYGRKRAPIGRLKFWSLSLRKQAYIFREQLDNVLKGAFNMFKYQLHSELIESPLKHFLYVPSFLHSEGQAQPCCDHCEPKELSKSYHLG